MSNHRTAKKGNGLSSLIIQQIGRSNSAKRRRGNDGRPVPDAPPVQRVDRENEQLADFLQGRTFQPPNPQHQTFQQFSQQNSGLQFQVPPTKYPGTKKRPFPFNLGQGQMGSAHKSDGDHKQQFGTPGGFEDLLDDFGDAKINEEDEESVFQDHEEEH